MSDKSYVSLCLQRAKSIFMHGFFTLLPIAVTLGFLKFLFKLIKSALVPIYNLEPQFLKGIPHSEIFIAIVVIFILGIVFDMFLEKPLNKIEDRILNKIPLLSQIYFGVKQLIKSLSSKDKSTLNKVVIVEFPHDKTYSIGFLTNEVTPGLFPSLTGTHYSVFIPATPNPLHGFYIIIPAERCTLVDMTRQDAMALIISGGIVQPPQTKK